MSSPGSRIDAPGDEELFLSHRQRLGALSLPEDPSDEELARNWTLAPADRKVVRGCRGDPQRRRFAVQLCTLRTYGRFLPPHEPGPLRISNHLASQVATPRLVLQEPPLPDNTEYEQLQRIRKHLGFHTFGEPMRETASRWVEGRAEEGHLPAEIFKKLEEQLLAWKVELPAPSTLERLIVSACVAAHERMYDDIARRLGPEMKGAIDKDCLSTDDNKSFFFQLKKYPPEATELRIRRFIDRLQDLEAMDVAASIHVGRLSPEMVAFLADRARRYDAYDVRRFAEPKRYALMACFLVDTRKVLYDQVVQMQEQYLTNLNRSAEKALKDRRSEYAGKRYRQHTRTMRGALGLFMDMSRTEATLRTEVLLEMEEADIRHAMSRYDEFERLDDRGFADELINRYSHIRRFLPDFLKLPFAAEKGSEPLLQAIEIARVLPVGKAPPADAPTRFISPRLQAGLHREDGSIDRRVWEIGMAFAVRDALRSGDLYLPDSKRHVSFSNMIFSDTRWEEEKPRCYADLSFSPDAEHEAARLATAYDRAASAALKALPGNDFAGVDDNGLLLHRDDKLELPASVKDARTAIDESTQRVRIEQLLISVDDLCGFTREFRRGPNQPRIPNFQVALLAALVAHGTNLGTAAMETSTDGISVDTLQHVTKWYITEERLRAANAVVVDFLHTLPIARLWGEGMVSSSDGQRFPLRGSSVLGRVYPRYFGYYDRAVTLYTHTADEFSVFSTQVISCTEREALYVLDGLLENDTILKHRQHMTDTHGFTELLFALCYLLGYDFRPRIADLPDQLLYKVARDASYGDLDGIFRGGTVKMERIKEQWDQMVRVAASLKNKTAKAADVMQRLTRSTDRLGKALQALGRVLKTIHILDYISDPELRRRIQMQLNRGEARHDLARWLFFAKRGEFARADYAEIMNKASCLSLLSNCVVLWNAVQMTRIVEEIRASGQAIADEDLAHIWPLAHRHVVPSGTYHFRRSQDSNLVSFPG